MDPSFAEIFPTVEELERACAERIVTAVAHAISERHVSALVLSGGETPRGVYRVLASDAFRERVDWAQVHILFTDERTVPPSDPQSNFGMLQREWLSRVPIPEEQVHRMEGDVDPKAAAASYGRMLRRTFERTGGVADFVLLGVGEDGHTASLFPGTTALTETDALTAAVFVPGLNSWRITLTLPVLNAARDVVFLVAGKKKSSIVRRVLSSTGPDQRLPATLVRPGHDRLRWMMDADAAAELKR